MPTTYTIAPFSSSSHAFPLPSTPALPQNESVPRQSTLIPLLAGAALVYTAATLAGSPDPGPFLHTSGQADTDLEVTGLIQGAHGFLRYTDLLHLPANPRHDYR